MRCRATQRGRRIVIGAAVVVVAVTVAERRHSLLVAVGRTGRVSLVVLVVAIVLEAASLAATAELQRRLLSGGGVRARFMTLLALVWASNAVGAVVPAGAAASSVYSYRHLTRRGTPNAVAGWLLVASGVLSAAALGLVAVIGAQLRGLLSACAIVDASEVGMVVTAVAASVALLAHATARPHRVGAVLSRLEDHATVCQRFVRRHTRTPTRPSSSAAIVLCGRAWAAVAFLAVLNWAADGAVLAVSVAGVGARPRWPAIVFAYAVSQIAVSLPVLPGSIGVAEGSLALVLVAAGVRAPDALAATLVYRLASFRLQLLPGCAAWVWLRHTRPFDQVTAQGRAPRPSQTDGAMVG
jgi:hypothetical protein